ncbi:hypothetical protein N7535_004574 [Penicillium sp. DV-2018c]|nr:hypothetical protein N7461_008154 [Penicillium sp. DV-2018c]KAJ5570914.1 hypothetical protein N7535_004574 [Penicillium sp. DV-2018c]
MAATSMWRSVGASRSRSALRSMDAYKGPDQETVQLTLMGEIKGYLEGRYVGPSEAINRLLGHRVHECIRSPSISRIDSALAKRG